MGVNPESIALGDFNRDGKLDQATANAGTNNVSILLGNGDGSFQAGGAFAANRGPTSVAAGDFNGDGFLDLVVTNFGTGDYYAPANFVLSTVSVLIGNGDGTFKAPQAFEAGSGPNAVVVGDFNGDGRRDLAVADYGVYPQRSNTVSILLGNGNGTFQAPQPFTAGNGVVGLGIGDFNRDGKQDLAVTNYVDNNVSVLLGNGAGGFQNVATLAVGVAPWTAVVADFNGDQLPDLAVTGHSSDIVSVLLGHGDGTFNPHVWYRTNRNPTGLAVGDLNGDGKADLVAANYFATMVSVLVGNGDGTFQNAKEFATGMAPMAVAIADFNGDGKPDLSAANYFEGRCRCAGTRRRNAECQPARRHLHGTVRGVERCHRWRRRPLHERRHHANRIVSRLFRSDRDYADHDDLGHRDAGRTGAQRGRHGDVHDSAARGCANLQSCERYVRELGDRHDR